MKMLSLLKSKPKVKFIGSLEECPVYVFFKIMETGDTRLLYTENAQPEKLTNVWDFILNQYLEATNNNSLQNNFRKRNYLLKMMAKFEVLSNAFVMAICEEFWEAEKLIKKLGYEIGLYDIEAMQRKLLELKSAIEIKANELIKANSTTDKSKKFDIYETLFVLSKFAGYRLDAKQINMVEFLSILESFKKANTKDNGRSKN